MKLIHIPCVFCGQNNTRMIKRSDFRNYPKSPVLAATLSSMASLANLRFICQYCGAKNPPMPPEEKSNDNPRPVEGGV
jgi:hypothetical protein